MPSIRFRETLAGGYALDRDGGTHLGRPISLALAAQVESLRRLARERSLAIRGGVDAAGLADQRPLRGTLTLLRSSARYSCEFTDNGGRACRLQGDQRLSLWGSPTPLTIIDGRISTEAGEPLGRFRLRFDLRSDLWTTLTSIRLQQRGQRYGS